MPNSPDPRPDHVLNSAETALLLVDVINDLEFPGGELLLPQARAMAQRAAELKRQARQAGIPVIYVNESHDRWRPSFSRQLSHCLQNDVRGRSIVRLLQPQQSDLFVLRSPNSHSLLTNLDTLIDSLRVRTLVLAGLLANICILVTANDTYLSGFRLFVPSDCVAAKTAEDSAATLEQMRHGLGAVVSPSTAIAFRSMGRHAFAAERSVG
jgi:nicotinamidase-related amidase